MKSQEYAVTSNRRRFTSFVLCASAALAACAGEDVPFIPATNTEVDVIAAYEALSSQLETCEDEQAACAAAAAGDPAKLEQCDLAAVSCNRSTEPTDAKARDALDRSASRCQDEARDGDDAGVADGEDAGAGGGGGGGHCIERRLPDVPKCVRSLVTCLNDAGLRERSASREEIVSCVQTAHSCFLEELAKWRDWRREQAAAKAAPTAGDLAGGGQAGQSAADSGGNANRGGAGGSGAEASAGRSGGNAGGSRDPGVGANGARGGVSRGGAAGGDAEDEDPDQDQDQDNDNDNDQDQDDDQDQGQDDGQDQGDDEEQDENEEECDWSQHAPFARAQNGGSIGGSYRGGRR